MSAMGKPFQFVTLVSRGGTPVTIADQTGAPYPTTGFGALVFNHEPELFSPTIHDATFTGTFPSPLTDNGDLYYHDMVGDTRLPMGTPGQILQSQADGLHWVDTAAAGGVPPGGTTGQILTKLSDTDFDSGWTTPPPPSGGAGTTYGTAQDVINSIVPAPVVFLTTQGYMTIGDGGAQAYREAGSQPLTNQAWIEDLSGRFFQATGTVLSLKALNAQGNGFRNVVTGEWTGANDTIPIKNWIQACIVLGMSGYAPPGNYLIPDGNVIAFDTGVSGLRLFGETGKTVFVHQIGHNPGTTFGSMISFGRVATSDTPAVPSYVNFVSENDSGILTTENLYKGLTQVVKVNTLNIAHTDDGTGNPLKLAVGMYVTAQDTTQPLPYRGGANTPITGITNSFPCIVTAPNNTVDPDDPDGELVKIFGVTGMTELNNGTFQAIADPDNPDLLTLPDVDSTNFGVYTGGGQIGTGGLAGNLSQVNRIIAVDPVAPSITWQSAADFNYNPATRIGVWWNPLTDIEISGIDIAYDQVRSLHEGVVAAWKFDNVLRLRYTNFNINYATTRCLTYENCLYGLLDKCIASFTPGLSANVVGIQLASYYCTVSNSLMERGGHLAQIGSNFTSTATSFIECCGCQGTAMGSLFDTHWHARNITFSDNQVGAQDIPFVGTIQRGAGLTMRGWYGMAMIDNKIFNHAEGGKMWQGGAMGSSVVSGNLFSGCRIGLTAKEYDKLVIEGNRFIDCMNTGLEMTYTTGPLQGFPIFSQMAVKKNTFIGASSLAAFYLKTQQQPLPLKGWTLQDFDISGNPANNFLGDGDMLGQLQYYIGGSSTEPAWQQHGPWYPLPIITGATVAVPDISGVTGIYRPGDQVTLAGGTSTQLAVVRVGEVVITAVVPTTGGRGFKVGDVLSLVGGVADPTSTHQFVTVTGIAVAETVDGVDYGPITTLSVNTPAVSYTALPGGNIFQGSTIFRTPPPGGQTGAWSNPKTYSIDQGVIFHGVPWISLQNANQGHRPDLSPTFWKLFPPNGTAARLQATATAPVVSPGLPASSGTYNETTGVITLAMASVAVTGATWAGGFATFTTATPHGILPGQQATVQGVVPTGYVGTNIAAAGTAGSTLVMPVAVNPGAYVSGGLAGIGHTLSVGQTAYLSGLTGTGAVGNLNGYWPTIAPTAGLTVTVQGPTNQQTITITGGTVTAPIAMSTIVAAGAYSVVPPNPVLQGSTTGTGTGIKYNMTWATNGMVDLTQSTRDLVLNQGAGTISELGPGINLHRLTRSDSDVTYVLGPRLIPPYGATFFARAGSTLEWYSDPNGVWRATNRLPSVGEEQYTQQFTFPPPPASGMVRLWADRTGRTWRQSSDGRNRGFLTETAPFWRATPQNNSVNFLENGAASTIVSGSYANTIAQPAITGTYNNGTGAITLTMASTVAAIALVGAYYTLSGLAGTGGFATLAGTWQISSISANGLTVVLAGPPGAGASTITSGTAVLADVINLTMPNNTLLVQGNQASVLALNGTGSFSALNGTWNVVAVSGTTVQLIGPRGAAASTVTTGTLTVPRAGTLYLGGTIVAQPRTNTNRYTRQPRVSVLAASANNSSGTFELNTPIYLNENGRVTLTWGLDIMNLGSSAFFGLKPSGNLPSTANPTNIANAMGVGFNSGQTTYRQIHGDASTPSASVDLGANYPAPLAAGASNQIDTWKLEMWWTAGATLVFWQLVRTLTSDGSTFVTYGTFTTEVPDPNTPLQLGMWCNNSNTGIGNQMAEFDAIYEQMAA